MTEQIPADTAATDTFTLTLKKPITYGGKDLEALTFRRVKAGDLKGLTLVGIFTAATDTVLAIARQACTTHLTMQQLEQLSARDIQGLSNIVADILAPAHAAALDFNAPLVLTRPIQAGGIEISGLDFREPTAGDLRGLHLSGGADLSVDFITTLAQRVSLQRLEPGDLAELDAADLIPIGGRLNRFFN